MTVLLEKGGRQPLAGLQKIKVCIGWDEVNVSGKIVPKKGLLGRLQNMAEEAIAKAESPDFDIDLICVICDTRGKRVGTVSYAGREDIPNKISLDRDDRRGNATAGGDDETIHVSLVDVRPEVDKLEFWCDIYDCLNRHQHFGMIRNAFARVVDEVTGTEICRLNLSEDYNQKKSIYICSIYKKDGEWKFKAEGSAGTATNLRQIEAIYN